MNQELAFLNGRFRPASEILLPPDDLGVLQGVAVSERLRTFDGRLYRLEDHLSRLSNSLAIIDVELEFTPEQIGQLAHELVAHNYGLLAPGDDLGLAIFATPGLGSSHKPTLAIHTCPLPFEQWVTYYTTGQALTETGITQIPASCWPLALKCRSRMHYYLADKRADRLDPGSRAVLLDQEGFVSEASTANIVCYNEDTGITSPPLARILPGVSLSVLSELAASLDIPMQYEDLGMAELASADEILLCSTSPCVWPVYRLNSQPAGGGPTGPLFRRLLSAWSEMVGLDIQAQAEKFSPRAFP